MEFQDVFSYKKNIFIFKKNLLIYIKKWFILKAEDELCKVKPQFSGIKRQ